MAGLGRFREKKIVNQLNGIRLILFYFIFCIFSMLFKYFAYPFTTSQTLTIFILKLNNVRLSYFILRM